jgi:hypothetical protein
MKPNLNRPRKDERSELIRLKAMRNALYALVGFMIVAIIVRIADGGKLGWEFWALIGTAYTLVISRRIYGDIEEPRDRFGRPLPVEDDKKSAAVRRRSYALDSVVFAAVCAVMEIFFLLGDENRSDSALLEKLFPSLPPVGIMAVAVALTVIIAFVASFLLRWLVGEALTVRAYRKELQKLDEESNGDE